MGGAGPTLCKVQQGLASLGPLDQKTVLAYTKCSTDSPRTPMTDARGNAQYIPLSVQRFPHFISARALHDKSVMEEFDTGSPFETRPPL